MTRCAGRKLSAAGTGPAAVELTDQTKADGTNANSRSWRSVTVSLAGSVWPAAMAASATLPSMIVVPAPTLVRDARTLVWSAPLFCRLTRNT